MKGSGAGVIALIWIIRAIKNKQRGRVIHSEFNVQVLIMVEGCSNYSSISAIVQW